MQHTPVHECLGLGVELLREGCETQVTPEHLSRYHVSKFWSVEEALGFCDILLLFGGSALFAGILALHHMGADLAPV